MSTLKTGKLKQYILVAWLLGLVSDIFRNLLFFFMMVSTVFVSKLIKGTLRMLPAQGILFRKTKRSRGHWFQIYGDTQVHGTVSQQEPAHKPADPHQTMWHMQGQRGDGCITCTILKCTFLKLPSQQWSPITRHTITSLLECWTY